MPLQSAHLLGGALLLGLGGGRGGLPRAALVGALAVADDFVVATLTPVHIPFGTALLVETMPSLPLQAGEEGHRGLWIVP